MDADGIHLEELLEGYAVTFADVRDVVLQQGWRFAEHVPEFGYTGIHRFRDGIFTREWQAEQLMEVDVWEVLWAAVSVFVGTAVSMTTILVRL